MQDWYLMTSTTRPNLTGGFENEAYLNYKDDAFAETLDTDIASNVTLYSSDLSTNLLTRCVIQNNVSDSQDKSVERQCLFQIGTLKKYTYLFFDNKYWLIINYISNNGLYEKAIVRLCNYMIKFQSPIGTILSYYCIDESSTSIGLDENKSITTVDGIHRIKLPFDDNTKLMAVDRRFFIDKSGKTTCKVTHVNNTEFDYGDRGLIVLTTNEDAYKPNVDINGVCDYFSPTTPTPTPQSGQTYYSILTCSNLKNEITSGSYRFITATLYDNESTINTTAIPIFSYVYPVGFENQFTVTPVNDHKIKLAVKDNTKLINQKVTVKVADVNGDYVGNIELTIKAGV
jgi:hypothetical protein